MLPTVEALGSDPRRQKERPDPVATQHPHTHLLGEGGDGLWRQFSGGAKAHELRDITGNYSRNIQGIEVKGTSYFLEQLSLSRN
jgi:hypothetical protein